MTKSYDFPDQMIRVQELNGRLCIVYVCVCVYREREREREKESEFFLEV